jgi:NodT family efflux transporter outer membrane factor (OMF) lipoprotein
MTIPLHEHNVNMTYLRLAKARKPDRFRPSSRHGQPAAPELFAIRSGLSHTIMTQPASSAPRRLHAMASMLALGLALGGCAAVGPDYIPPKADVPTAWSPTGGVAAAKAEDLSQWWQRLHDPLLADLVHQALAGSPDLMAAQARLRQARARRALAGAQRFPSVNASGAASRGKASGGTTHNLFSAGFDASWEPDVFGGVRRGIEAAQADLETSEANLHATQVSLAAEVALNYVELRALQGRLAIARENLANQEETLQLTQWRAQAGLVTSLDVEQARTSVEQTRAQIPLLETSLAEAAHRLAILAGQPPAALQARLAAAAPIPAVPGQVAVGIPADTLRQRPDVLAAERHLAAETARIGVQTANLYPALQLNGSLGVNAATLGGLADGGAGAASLLASVAGTIFDAGRLRQQVAIQTAVQEEALANYQAAVLTALEDVENALVALAQDRTRAQTLLLAAKAAGNAAQLARQQYAAGLVDFQSVLNTQRTLLSAQDSLKSGEADTATALIQLYKALGGGWSATATTADQPR